MNLDRYSLLVPPAGSRTGGRSGTARQAPAQAAAPGGRFAWLAPMVLWPVARRFLPRPTVRPQGGGTQRADDEAMFAAILYVLVSGAPWRALPKTFAVSWQNAHRRFTQWSSAGLWDRIQEAARGPQMPAAVRQWADTTVALAEERLNRMAAAAGSSAGAGAAAAVPQSEGLKPAIRLHAQGDFTARLFGPSHSAESPVRDRRMRRAE
ncbi:transposase [Streptomyces sp. NBC_00388]|uniref:transposase n=1 Tax=Streptomyces sp. NBC_00388 TaxID=2975735 RepID=UPI002E20736E